MSKASRRQELLSPYADPHARSMARRAEKPRNLLLWFLEGFRAEMPEDMHGIGVWRDWVRLDEERAAEGGSLLGSPTLADQFRRFIEGSAFATEPAEFEGHEASEDDEHYVFPMRAAVVKLARQDPFMARLLASVAFRDGDWVGASEALGIVAWKTGPEDIAVIDEQATQSLRRVYFDEALHRLWRRFEVQPPPRVIREVTAA